MLESGTDPESYITDSTLVYADLLVAESGQIRALDKVGTPTPPLEPENG